MRNRLAKTRGLLVGSRFSRSHTDNPVTALLGSDDHFAGFFPASGSRALFYVLAGSRELAFDVNHALTVVVLAVVLVIAFDALFRVPPILIQHSIAPKQSSAHFLR